MTIKATIRHDGSTSATATLQVTVVVVGKAGAQDQIQRLKPGEEATVEVAPDQFVMIDHKEGD